MAIGAQSLGAPAKSLCGWRSEAPQGHVTAYLDCPGIPGAAYTALSRVSYGKDIMIGGAVTAAHFQPVDEAKDG